MASILLSKSRTVLSIIAVALFIALGTSSSSLASETEWGGVYATDGEPGSEPESGTCDRGVVRGLRFQRWRYEDGDRDMYAFRLICTEDSQSNEFGPVRGNPGGDSYTAWCPNGTVADGLKLYRQIRNQGDLHTYRFMLLCTRNADSGWVGPEIGDFRDVSGVSCPGREVMYGMRSWHWRHSAGDRDYYRFQLFCDS
jgi:hypothetical protein